jgi:hypothetical protein
MPLRVLALPSLPPQGPFAPAAFCGISPGAVEAAISSLERTRAGLRPWRNTETTDPEIGEANA